MAKTLIEKNYTIVSGGTDNHLMLIDLNNKKIDGARAQICLDYCKIYSNKNSIPGDTSALTPGGVRIGSPAMTTRGFTENDFVKVADFFDRGINLARRIKAENIKDKKISSF